MKQKKLGIDIPDISPISKVDYGVTGIDIVISNCKAGGRLQISGANMTSPFILPSISHDGLNTFRLPYPQFDTKKTGKHQLRVEFSDPHHTSDKKSNTVDIEIDHEKLPLHTPPEIASLPKGNIVTDINVPQ